MEANRSIKNILLILSGKGGVGKSTVTCQLAHSLNNKGFKVGVLDVDLCGPSVPKMFNVESYSVHQTEAGWMPIFVNKEQTLSVMSIGFLLNDKSEAVVWRGPKKNCKILLAHIYYFILKKNIFFLSNDKKIYE
jgi:Mrp family chromosome partitioning ATPase